MEFSNMLKRCKLSELSDYFLDLGQSPIEKEDLDYEVEEHLIVELYSK